MSSREPSGRIRQILAALLATAAMLLSVPLVLGYWGELHPALDSLSHFRVHLAALMILTALPLLFVGGWRRIGLGMIVLGLASIATVAVYPGPEARADSVVEETATSATYRLLHLNLRYDNRTPKDVLSLIGRVDADVVTLNEVSAAWRPQLETIRNAYPHQIVCPPPAHIGGVAILSRRPFLHPATAHCHDRGAMAVATINFAGSAVDIVALHLGWPWPFDQHNQVDRILPVLKALPASTILAGDFNATPWSMTARRVADAGGLSILNRIGPTWLIRSAPDAMRRLAGLPLDNIMVKGAVTPLSTKREASVGSDHLPVLLNFRLKPLAPPETTMQAQLGAAADRSHMFW